MTTLFVSDIHLSTARPEIVAVFIEFLRGPARKAEALYILGDCFDRYLGDDDDTPPHREVISALADLTRAAGPVFVLHGNHDFLLGPSFERATGCKLLDDHKVIDLYGTKVLIAHGDTLCTDDIDYQEFRRFARDPGNQQAFLKLPLAARAIQAEKYRARSQEQTRLKPEEIMDVNPGTVVETMRSHNVLHLIHGHTHRPKVHDVDVHGSPGKRIVLGDWYEQDSVLVWDRSGYRLGRIESA